jgi:2-succinyl-6-hydroxy-2,4-cyclohexadiene-1-carboxylate synthase
MRDVGWSAAWLGLSGNPPHPPVLVALHGWLLSGRLWGRLERELRPGWSLLAPDLPGFGTTPRPRGLQPSLASYGRWVADWVEREVGRQQPVVLLGHSLGGSVALHAAGPLGKQLKGLVQISAGGGVYQPRPFRQLRRGGSLLLGLRPRGLAHWPLLSRLRSPLLADQRAARGLLACSTNRGAVRQLPQLTHALTVPSLWIAGSQDQVMAPRYVRHLAGYSPAHRLEVLEGAGHLPMCQMPRDVAAVIQAWLDQEVQNVARPFSCSSAN